MKTMFLPACMSTLVLIGAGCQQQPQATIPLTQISNAPTPEIPLPDDGPQFDCQGFSLAQINPELRRVELVRPQFRFHQRTRIEHYTVMHPVQISREITDSQGRKQTQVEESQVEEERTREIADTEFEQLDPQHLSCAIADLIAFDVQGNPLSSQQIEIALKRLRRVILQTAGTSNDSFYCSFLHPETLILQSHGWVDESEALPVSGPAPIPPAPVVE